MESDFEGSIERCGSSFLVRVPEGVLTPEYTARPAIVTSEFGKCRATVVRLKCDDVGLLLSRSQLAELSLPQSSGIVRLRLRLVKERLQLSPPRDFETALRDAGIAWESVPERDRHLMIGLVKEAKTPQLRQERIKKILLALEAGRQ